MYEYLLLITGQINKCVTDKLLHLQEVARELLVHLFLPSSKNKRLYIPALLSAHVHRQSWVPATTSAPFKKGKQKR